MMMGVKRNERNTESAEERFTTTRQIEEEKLMKKSKYSGQKMVWC